MTGKSGHSSAMGRTCDLPHPTEVTAGHLMQQV